MSEYIPDQDKVIAEVERKKFSGSVKEVLIEKIVGEINE